MFNLWSQNSTEAKNTLKPDLGMGSWDTLSKEEKERIWLHLCHYFYDRKDLINDYEGVYRKYTNENGYYYTFYQPNSIAKRDRITFSIAAMNKFYKVNNYAKNYLSQSTHFSACEDFYMIFCGEESNAVLEMLSFYCKVLLSERKDYRERYKEESQDNFLKEKENWQYEEFDAFAQELNEVFSDFGLNIYLTKNGFIPKQDDKIIKEIFEPVIQCLTNEKWKDVNNLLTDAFSKYRENTPSGYSSCVTHTVAALEAFLQITVKGKAGEGDFATLIVEGQRKNLIPSDIFTKEMFKTIISILMRERKVTGDAHVKQEYATEKNAKMVLNLSMIFLQHCMIN